MRKIDQILRLWEVIDFLEKMNPELVCTVAIGTPSAYRGDPDGIAFGVRTDWSIMQMRRVALHADGHAYWMYKGGYVDVTRETLCYVGDSDTCCAIPLTYKWLLEMVIANSK